MEFWGPVIGRWLHMISTTTLIGAAVFQYFALLPAAATLPDDAHQQLREQVLARWRKLVHPLAGMVLVSGFYNFIAVAVPLHRGTSGVGLYHGLMGIKILLGFIAVGLAVMLTGKSSFAASLRKDMRKYVGINLVLVTLILLIGGFLKVRGVVQ